MTPEETGTSRFFAASTPPSASGSPGLRRRKPRRRRVRGARRRRARAVRRARGSHRADPVGRRAERVLGERRPGDVFGRCPSCSARSSCGIPGVELVARDADRGSTTTTPSRLSRRGGGDRWESWRRTEWTAREGSRGSPQSLPPRANVLAIAGIRPAPSCGASSTATRSASNGSAGLGAGGRRVGRSAAGRRRSAGDPRRGRQDRHSATAAAGGRAPGPRHRGRGRGVRHRRRRGGARWAWPQRSTRVGGPRHDRDRAGGTRRPGGTSSRIENYLGFPSGVSGDELASRALRQARRLGAEILVTRSISRIDPAARQVHLDGGDVLRHARSSSPAESRGDDWRSMASTGWPERASPTARRAARPRTPTASTSTSWCGQLAGQAALFFSTHARSVTILCRSDRLEKSMSRYLIDQLAGRPNIGTMFGTEVAAVHGDLSLEAIDVRDTATGATSRLDSEGLFIFIGADAETAWLPPDIALDDRGYVLTGPEMRSTGCWTLERDPYLLETSVPGIFACGDVRQGPVKRGGRGGGRGQHGHRLRAPVPQGSVAPPALCGGSSPREQTGPRARHRVQHRRADARGLSSHHRTSAAMPMLISSARARARDAGSARRPTSGSSPPAQRGPGRAPRRETPGRRRRLPESRNSIRQA